jgi:hypothetical protein
MTYEELLKLLNGFLLEQGKYLTNEQKGVLLDFLVYAAKHLKGGTS